MKSYTITDMARIVNIPPSTASYYRDKFQMFLPSRGRGRKRRYTKEALDTLKKIVELKQEGRSTEFIQDTLRQAGPIIADIDNGNSIEQQRTVEPIKMVNLLDKIVDQKNRIENLEKDVRELREYIKNNQLTWWQRLLKNRKGDNGPGKL